MRRAKVGSVGERSKSIPPAVEVKRASARRRRDARERRVRRGAPGGRRFFGMPFVDPADADRLAAGLTKAGIGF
jgi:hypothetical protein